jgi:uncharacterized protein (DUF3084 family)
MGAKSERDRIMGQLIELKTHLDDAEKALTTMTTERDEALAEVESLKKQTLQIDKLNLYSLSKEITSFERANSLVQDSP